MTDTTDTAALREFLMEQIDHADSYGGKVWLCAEDARLAMSSLDQLEAERQRADRYHFVAMSALESQAEISEQLGISEDECDGSPEQIHEKIEMLQTELAALKTDIESYISISGELATELEELKGDQVPVALVDERQGSGGFCLTQYGRRLNLQHGTELFTAPQKPVVLDDVTVLAWGERNHIKGDVSKLRCMIDDAVSLPAAIEAAGGIVKDGE